MRQTSAPGGRLTTQSAPLHTPAAGVRGAGVVPLSDAQPTLAAEAITPATQELVQKASQPHTQVENTVHEAPQGQIPPNIAVVPQPAAVEKVVDSPVIEYVEVPRLVIAWAAEQTLEVLEAQTVAGATSSENLSSAPACQTAPAEAVQVAEVGPPLPAESASAIRPQTPTGPEDCTTNSIVDGGKSAGSLAGVDAPVIVPTWAFRQLRGHDNFKRFGAKCQADAEKQYQAFLKGGPNVGRMLLDSGCLVGGQWVLGNGNVLVDFRTMTMLYLESPGGRFRVRRRIDVA